MTPLAFLRVCSPGSNHHHMLLQIGTGERIPVRPPADFPGRARVWVLIFCWKTRDQREENPTLTSLQRLLLRGQRYDSFFFRPPPFPFASLDSPLKKKRNHVPVVPYCFLTRFNLVCHGFASRICSSQCIVRSWPACLALAVPVMPPLTWHSLSSSDASAYLALAVLQRCLRLLGIRCPPVLPPLSWHSLSSSAAPAYSAFVVLQ